jgi:hypothetical protein
MRTAVRWMSAAVLAALVASVTTVGSANAQLFGNSKLYVGALSCNISGSVGFIFGSSKDLNCILIRSDGTSELYTGKINRFGIDIGFTKAIHLVWHVYSLDEKAPPGALAGNYVGSQTSVSWGGTADTYTLVGGANHAIILNSVAVQGGHTGLNLADGIADISLVQARY